MLLVLYKQDISKPKQEIIFCCLHTDHSQNLTVESDQLLNQL